MSYPIELPLLVLLWCTSPSPSPESIHKQPLTPLHGDIHASPSDIPEPSQPRFPQVTPNLSRISLFLTHLSWYIDTFIAKSSSPPLSSSECENSRLTKTLHQYNISGLTTKLYNLPLSLCDTILSHKTPDVSLHFIYLAPTWWVTSLSNSPFPSIIDPRCLKLPLFWMICELSLAFASASCVTSLNLHQVFSLDQAQSFLFFLR